MVRTIRKDCLNDIIIKKKKTGIKLTEGCRGKNTRTKREKMLIG